MCELYQCSLTQCMTVNVSVHACSLPMYSTLYQQALVHNHVHNHVDNHVHNRVHNHVHNHVDNHVHNRVHNHVHNHVVVIYMRTILCTVILVRMFNKQLASHYPESIGCQCGLWQDWQPVMEI